jgi:hypothetical protein
LAGVLSSGNCTVIFLLTNSLAVILIPLRNSLRLKSLINRPIQNYRYHERILYVIQLSDRVYNVSMSYRQTTERFNVSHSVIVRLKQRVNQTGNAKERQRTWQPLKTTREFCKGTRELIKPCFVVL